MAETLLNLQRIIGDFSQNEFFGMTKGFGQAEATISARSNGTFERFRMIIVPSGAPNFPSGNESNSLVTLDLLINNVVQPNSKIQITSIGQTGTFLPISQLPVGFLQDDDIVVRLTGMSAIPPSPFPFVRMEVNFDLKFDPAPPPPLEASVVLRLTTQGSNFNLPHQFSHYTKRRCDIASSSASGIGNFIGRTITHVRMQAGNQVSGNAQPVYLGIYMGVGNAAVFAGRTISFNWNDLNVNDIFDVPLQVPIVLTTDQADEIAITTVIDGTAQIHYAGDSLNSDRFRLTKGFGGAGFANAVPPNFPSDFLNGADGLSNEAPLQRLINQFTIPGGLINER